VVEPAIMTAATILVVSDTSMFYPPWQHSDRESCAHFSCHL